MTDNRLSREETKDDAGTQLDDRPWWWRASVYLLDRIWFLVGVLGAGVAGLLVLGSLLGWNLSVPRTVQIGGGAALVSFLTVGRWTGKRTLDLLWDPSYIWVVDLDAQRLGAGGIYRWPSQQFRELDVVDGQLDWLTPHLAVGKNVDLDGGTIEGTWRGTMSDRELLLKIENIKECRGRLEEDAKRGFSIEAQAHSIVRVATQRSVLRIVDTFERATLPDDGEALANEIDAALDSFGVDDHVRQSMDDLEDEMPDLDDDLVDDALDDATSAASGAVDKEAPADD